MIDNPRSPRVRAVAKLAKKDARAETGLFLLEGPQAVSEALAFRPELVVELFVTPTALERYAELAQAVADAELKPHFVTEHVLETMADTVTPQGVVAVCRQFPVALKDILAEAPRLVAVLEEVRDPGNAGTIIRAADAAGADAVVLTGRSVDLYNPKVVRATTGSIFHLPVAMAPELGPVLDKLRGVGLTVLAADIKGDDLLDARRDGTLGEADRVAVRQRGPRAHGRAPRARRSRDHRADLRPRGVDEPCHRGFRLPVRERIRPALVTERA